MKGLNKQLFLWIYYDFANSIPFIIVSFYFPLYLIQDRGAPDYLISLCAIFSTIFLLLTLPSLGHLADKKNSIAKFLKIFTVLAAINLIVLNFQIFFTANIYLLSLTYLTFLYFYQSSISFYNPLINDNNSKISKESISGMGLAAGQFGNVIGLSLAIPLAGFLQKSLNTDPRQSALLFPGIFFVILMIPFLLKYKNNKVKSVENTAITISFKDVLKILKDRNPALFLLAFFFYSDAILTLQIFASIVLEKVAHLNDKEKTITFLIGLVFAILGGLTINKTLKYIKDLKKFIVNLIIISSFLMFAVALTTGGVALSFLIVVFSLLYGVLFSLSRTFYYDLIPHDKKAQYFSIYTLFERLASILGPSVWALTLFLSSSFIDETRYRFALASLGVLGLIGGFIFTKIKYTKPVT